MATAAQETTGVAPSGSEPHPRRWIALAVIAIAQLMVVLDATIVNIALPNAKAALHISNANQQWVVTAYTLTFGGFLLLGGRIADYWGRKRTFLVGSVGFAVASRDRRPGPERHHAVRRAGAAGRVRRAARPGLAGAAHRAVHRGPRAGQGVRRVRRDRRRRLGGRPAARRRAHRVRQLALVPAGEHPGRPGRAGPGHPAGAREQGARQHHVRHPWRDRHHRRPRLAGLRLHRGGQAGQGLGRRHHDRLHRGRRAAHRPSSSSCRPGPATR